MSHNSSVREFAGRVQTDLARKLVLLTGARQAGKTTLARQLMAHFEPAQYLNWDVPADRQLIVQNAWSPKAKLVVFDEIHKMRDCSVRELMVTNGLTASAALERLLARGGFPEPCLAASDTDADRWRAQYATDLIREDVLEFSRVHELRTMQLMFEMLRERVGSPVTLSKLAQALQISPTTATRYVEILESLYIVFRVTPWHRDVARSLLKEAKIYFLDSGLVKGDAGVKLENAVAAMLLKHCHHRQDAEGKAITLHTIRDKERHEIDFVLAEGDSVTDLVEVKLSDTTPSAYLHRMAERMAPARAVQIVAELRQPAQHGRVEVCDAAKWLGRLSA